MNSSGGGACLDPSCERLTTNRDASLKIAACDLHPLRRSLHGRSSYIIRLEASVITEMSCSRATPRKGAATESMTWRETPSRLIIFLNREKIKKWSSAISRPCKKNRCPRDEQHTSLLPINLYLLPGQATLLQGVTDKQGFFSYKR